MRVGGACACMLYARKSAVGLHVRSQSGGGVEGEGRRDKVGEGRAWKQGSELGSVMR